jgi:hypothetical protein
MYFSPKTSADGLVFHYDTGNTVRSYLGEPTVNLLYSAGATNLTNGAGDIYGRCTKTDLGNGKYRFVNNGTGVSTVRVYTNQGDLLNGATYACSVYYENLVGGIGIDWCDTGITGLNYSTNVSGRLGGYGTRGTYDGPYYFLDINFDSGGAVTLYNPQVEYKSHVTPFVAGTRSATQGLKDLTAASTINLSNVSFDANAQMTFDGTNDTVSIPSNSSNNIAGDITMELVLNRTAGYSAAVMHKEQQYTLYVYSSGAITYADSSIWSYSTFGAFGNLTTGTYHHLVATKTGGVVKIYLDGTVIINKSFGSAITQTNNTLYVGSYDGSSNYFGGEIPVSKVYNRALTADEVARNYNAIKSRFNIG